jgi:hypothetical protein
MQIPSEYRAFSKPTLLVVTNTLHAKFFLANNRMIEEKGEIDVSSELEQVAGDGISIELSGGAGQTVMRSNDDTHDTWKKHVTEDHLYTHLNNELMKRLQNQEFEVLVFTVPEEQENELKESLHIQLLKCTNLFIPKNLINHDLLDIVAEVQEEQGI